MTTRTEILCKVCPPSKRTRVERGYVCPRCLDRMIHQLDDLVRLVIDASAELTPAKKGSGGGHSTGSKPPISLDNAAPHMVTILRTPGDHRTATTVTAVLASWEALIRMQQGLTPYEKVATVTIPTGARPSGARLAEVSFVRSLGFLKNHLTAAVQVDDFDAARFADELGRCVARVNALVYKGVTDRVVKCPTIFDDGTEAGEPCDYPITLRTWAPLAEHDKTGRADWSTGDLTYCRNCGTERSVTQLLHAAGKEGAWASADDIAIYLGISAPLVRKWAKHGDVARDRGMYSWGDALDAHEAWLATNPQPRRKRSKA